jgi:hypothetical protein
MTKIKTVFPLKLKSRGAQMAEFMAAFMARSNSDISCAINLLSYCEKFFCGVPVRTLIEMAAERELHIKAHSGRHADGKYFWRVVLLKDKQRFLCFFGYPKGSQVWDGDFASIVQDYRALKVARLEMKRVTRRQRDRELARLNPGLNPFIPFPKR